MENIALIGIDLGKNSFHIHCQDRRGKAVYRKKFTRPKLIEFLATCPATTIAMEACGGSHFMARKLEELGHWAVNRDDSKARPDVFLRICLRYVEVVLSEAAGCSAKITKIAFGAACLTHY